MKIIKNIQFGFVILIFSIIMLPIAPPVLAEQVLQTKDIDQFVNDYIKRNGLPGVSIVVVKNGKLVYEKGYGHDSNGQPITEKSLMRLASGSKPFTAFAVLQLVNAGKIQLDDQVVKHLSTVKLDDVRWNKVTVRQLLSHTSGLPNPTIIAPANTLKAGVERLHSWKLQSQPGEQYAYSNANYWVLARLVEEVSGISFASYLKQKIFSPLGMNDSLSPVNTGDVVQSLPKGHVTAYGTAIPWTELEQMFTGSGQIVTSASDMGKWLAVHLNKGKSESSQQILSQKLLAESYLPQLKNGKYGLGWSLSSPNVKPARISHSGNLSTYQSQQDIIPNSGYAIAVLLNSFTPTLEHAYEISSGIIQLTEGEKPKQNAPLPKIIDLSLGAIMLIYLVLAIKGIIRSKMWADRRKQQPTWRFILRLTPQLIPVLFIGWLFFIVPSLQNNSSTIKDTFGLFPAAMLFLSIIFITGFIITASRLFYRVKAIRQNK